MNKKWGLGIAVVLSLGGVGGVAEAQARPDSSAKAPVPAAMMPPKGMCRIWIEGVPAARQPASTTCDVAIKNKPANGTVIFGDAASPASTTPAKTVATPTKPPTNQATKAATPPVTNRGRGGGG